MCGIAAFFQPGRPFSPDLIDAVDRDLFHRGPDSGGHLSEPGRALIFRRLAIQDPQARADQPMTDPAGDVTLIFNGEIYNFPALRNDLEQRGYVFRTTGDTEVILNGYLCWGDGLFDRLEGMFALVLVDRRKNIALIARDPLGIKPLYLLRRGTLTAVASEARPLHRFQRAEANPAAISELLTFGWAAGRISNYRGIERLPGGTLLTVDLSDGSVTERRYSDPLETLEADATVTAEEAEDAFARSLEAHLISDVGYSLQLSGGVDSSLVAAMAAGLEDRRLKSFSIGLEGHAYDETPYQTMVAERYGLEHEVTPLSVDEYCEALPTAIRHMEGPTPHGGCTTLMMLCRRIQKETKVVLTGEGADEFFGGYLRYGVWRKTAQQERLAGLIPSWLSPPVWPFKGINRLRGLDAAAYGAVYHDFGALNALFPDLVPEPGLRERVSGRFADFRDRLFAVDQTAYLESLLVRQDKMSMAASVEARVPFTHLPLARVLNRLPHDLRAPGGETKPVLKRIAEKYLPMDLTRRRKIGLWLPYHEWYRDRDRLGRYLDMVTAPDSRLASFGDRKRLSGFVEKTLQGDRSAGLILQRLAELELWLRSVDQEAAPMSEAA